MHRALVTLEARGVVCERFAQTPEGVLGWIDAEFGDTWSSQALAGGIWFARDAEGPVGFAAFDARGLGFHWLRPWSARDGVGVFGPHGVVERAHGRGVGEALLGAALFSLRERGYRQALIPAVASDELVAYYARHANAHVVESFDLGRHGRRWRATVLASGNGTNLQAVLDGVAAGTVPLDVRALVVNRTEAFARERAARARIPSDLLVWGRQAESREAYDARVLSAVIATEPELVLLLGWMHVLPAAFVAQFPQMLNVHPAFLPLDPALEAVTMPDGSVVPAYRGPRAVDLALADGVQWIGASVHRVGVAVDRGAVLARAPLRLVAGEPREVLDARLHALEHSVLAAAIRRWSWEQP